MRRRDERLLASAGNAVSADAQPLHVMPGLVPGIHVFTASLQDVDGRA
jgi:hypothetical protein